jgi:hypothetical protein
MKKVFCILTAIFAISTVSAQGVGINTSSPDESALLDIASTTKGILPPRIDLTSPTLDLDGIPGQATGLLIYNSGNKLARGYYYWDGSEWKTMDNSTSIAPEISSINCSTVTLSPSSYTTGVPYSGILKVTYSGGNGGTYPTGTAFTVNGLIFQLHSGKLLNGTGELTFSISGTPTVSSPTATVIPINSTTVPAYTGISCDASVGGEERADIKVSATVGPLRITTDPSPGYDRIITSPDGKFSVRVVINSGGGYDLADLQIRSNSGTPTIMWNAGTEYVNGQIVQGNNGMAFPAQGVWYGNGAGNGTTLNPSITNAWGDADVYYGSPEYRRYTWTNTDPTDKATYTLTFMMGASNFGPANTTNCPSGVCTNTKAFLRIEQIRAAE